MKGMSCSVTRRRNRYVQWPGVWLSPWPGRRSRPCSFTWNPAIALCVAIRVATGVALCTALCCAGPVMAAPLDEIVKAPAPSGPLTFEQCLGVALEQSPFLTVSSLEIDVRRLDESDSRFGFVPSMTLRTRGYLNRPSGSQPYSIELVTEPFNPVASYFTLQARKVITRMAGLGHLQAVSDFILRLGLGFLELDALSQVEAYQDEIITLTRRNRAYAEEKLHAGGSSALEARVVIQEADLAVLERERLESSRSTMEAGMKNLLGAAGSRDFSLNTTNARWQVLGSFDPVEMTYSHVQANSIELQIQHMKQELQKRYVSLARARFLPTLLFKVETSDPLSRSEDGELFFSVGLELPLWDGLERFHDISRQEIVLQKYNAEAAIKDIDLAAKWDTAQNRLKNASADLELARAREELADLKKRRVEISYHSGSASFGAFLAESKEYLDARKNTVMKALEKDKAILGLRHLSGDLYKAYVDTSLF